MVSSIVITADVQSVCSLCEQRGLDMDMLKMLNVKAIIVSKMKSHCVATVQMREESERDKKERRDVI